MQRDINMFEALQLAQITAANIQYNIETDQQGRIDLVMRITWVISAR